MPFYALDDNNRLIEAPNADLFRRYRCLECKGLVLKRTGRDRRPHFYHLHTVKSCRLHSQSIDHLIMQSKLKEKNPALFIERPFEKILRIADLCWEEKKIVFEIQCSPIDPSQALARRNDYAQEGYHLVWLLDDRLYNRPKALRIAEKKLRNNSCYYFSLAQSNVYDQFEVFHEEQRVAKGPRLLVDLLTPMRSTIANHLLVSQLQSRESNYFKGDLMDKVISYPQYLEKLIEHEQGILSSCIEKTPFMKKWAYIAWEWILWRSVKNTK